MVALEHQRPGPGHLFVLAILDAGHAQKLLIVLDDYAVLNDGGARLFDHLSVGVEAGRAEEDVVGLPLARLAGGIDDRRLLAVERAASMRLRFGAVRIEDLYLIATVRRHPAVAMPDGLAIGVYRRAELGMHVAVSEFQFAGDVGLVRRSHTILADAPSGWLVGIALIP